MKPFSKLIFLIIFFSVKANAFDRLFCQSNLRDWIVTLTSENRTAVLTPFKQSITLTKEESENLIIKNTDDQIVATIFPWNSLYVRNGKEVADKYSIKSLEDANGFVIEITEKPSSFTRRLSCRFTF